MGLYRKKPVVIEARQVPDPFDYDETCAVIGWVNDNGGHCAATDHDIAVAIITTLEGDMFVDIGDWVIRGVAGEFYPCKPGIFEATYEPILASITNGPARRMIESIRRMRILRETEG